MQHAFYNHACSKPQVEYSFPGRTYAYHLGDMCISIQDTWFNNKEDETRKQCSNASLEQSDFCSFHYQLTRPFYQRYKRATEVALNLFQQIGVHTSNASNAYIRCYAKIVSAIQLRKDFTTTFIHPSQQDLPHKEFIDNLVTLQVECEQQLTSMFAHGSIVTKLRSFEVESKQGVVENDTIQEQIIQDQEHVSAKVSQETDLTQEEFLDKCIEDVRKQRQENEQRIAQIVALFDKFKSLQRTLVVRKFSELLMFHSFKTETKMSNCYLEELLNIYYQPPINVVSAMIGFVVKLDKSEKTRNISAFMQELQPIVEQATLCFCRNRNTFRGSSALLSFQIEVFQEYMLKLFSTFEFIPEDVSILTNLLRRPAFLNLYGKFLVQQHESMKPHWSLALVTALAKQQKWIEQYSKIPDVCITLVSLTEDSVLVPKSRITTFLDASILVQFNYQRLSNIYTTIYQKFNLGNDLFVEHFMELFQNPTLFDHVFEIAQKPDAQLLDANELALLYKSGLHKARKNLDTTV